MRTRFTAAALLVAASLAATLAGASAARAVRPLGLHALRPHGAVRNAAVTPDVYFAVDVDTSAAALYASSDGGSFIWEIPGLDSHGMAVDATGNVYVGTDSYPQGVYVFPPSSQSGPPKPVRFLDDRGFDPAGIAVEANGTVLVANTCYDTLGLNLDCVGALGGNVVAYRQGAARPYVTYNLPSGQRFPLSYVTADHEGNVYASGNSAVYQWTSPKHIRLLPLDSNSPGGLVTDAADDLVVADAVPANAGSVEVFAHGSWLILRKFTVGPGQAFGVQSISLDQSNSKLYTATYEVCDPKLPATPVIHIFDYATGASTGCFNVNNNVGYIDALAANPEAIP